VTARRDTMDGNKLKRMRIEKGVSLSKLSEQTGISKSYLSLIERNIQKKPSLDILAKIAETFGVKVEDLVRREEAETELFYKKIPPVKSKLKVEIELSEDQLTPKKLKQIKELIDALNAE
jgi:transcriptional regulator with XRE-family HTH domain